MWNRGAVELGVELGTVVAGAVQDRDRQHQAYSSSLQIVKYSHAIDPAGGFELIAP